MEQLDIQPYLGWNEADSHENPLEFDWLLSKKKVCVNQCINIDQAFTKILGTRNSLKLFKSLKSIMIQF